MQVNSVLSSCLGKRPLQTSCLNEALTSSALIALTGSGRLFISPFFFTESSLWLIWRRLKLCSVIYSADSDTDGHQKNMKAVCVCVCVLHNKLWKWHQMSEVKYVCFSKHGCHLYLDECSSAFSHISSAVFRYAMSSMNRYTVCTERAKGMKTQQSHVYLMLHTSGFGSIFFSSLANWLLFIVRHRDPVHYIETLSMWRRTWNMDNKVSYLYPVLTYPDLSSRSPDLLTFVD